MNTNQFRFGRVVLGVVIGVGCVVLPVLADEAADTAQEKLRVDPMDIEVLLKDVDTASSKFEEYRDMDSGPFVRWFHLRGTSADNNRDLDVDVSNAGRADARYMIRYRNSGRYAIRLDYNVIPHRFGNNGITLHTTTSGRGTYTIPDTAQLSLQTAVEDQLAGGGAIDFAFLGSQLQPFIDSGSVVSPRLERRRINAVFEGGKQSRIGWKVDLRQETRDGSRPYGATFGFGNAIELPEPIRYDTRIAELSGEWRADRGGLRFGLNVSSFANAYDTLIYDNPWRLTDTTDSNAYTAPGSRSIGGPSTGRNALSPDNRAGSVFFSGHARLGEKGWFNGNLSFGTMEQDEPLLPYTINTAINENVVDPTIRPPFDASLPSNLPARSADAKVDTLHLTANAGTKIGGRSSVKFRVRYYDYDNKTPRIELPGYVRMDAVWEAIPRITVPYAYTSQKLGVEFGFDPSPKTHMAWGYDRESWDRDFREIKTSDEDLLHFTVDTRALERVTLSGGWTYGDRKTDEYRVDAQLYSFTDPDEEVNNLPSLRKYDEAERTYNKARLSALISASDSVQVSLGASLRDDDYGESEHGLISDEITDFNAEVSYVPSEKISFVLFGQRTDRETFQRARQSGATPSTNPADDWELTLSEVTDTWGVAINSKLTDRVFLDLTGSWSNSDGQTDFFSPPGGNPDTARGFDEYDDNEWLVYSARLGVQVSPRVRASVTLQRDEFTTNRFTRLGLRPYLPGGLILDLEDGDYEASLAMVNLRIAF